MNAIVRAEASKVIDVLKGADYQAKFRATMPAGVNLERFTAVVVRAVQEDPKLLSSSTDKASLFLACQHAAQAGLLPDKREGALVMYGDKVQFLPMIAGLRKRLAGAGYDLRAELVHQNDDFDYSLGDEPHLTHKPAPFGKDRGPVIGAYAVATNLATGAKYREVMDVSQLDAVQKVSRGSGGPWTGPFKGEMQRKTVGRRCIKQLPIDDRVLNEILERDNADNFDLSAAEAGKREASSTASKAQEAARGATQATTRQDEAVDAEFTEQPPERDEREPVAGDPDF